MRLHLHSFFGCESSLPGGSTRVETLRRGAEGAQSQICDRPQCRMACSLKALEESYLLNYGGGSRP